MFILKNISTFLMALLLFCMPSTPVVPQKLGAPQFNSIELSVHFDQSGYNKESVHLTWKSSPTDSSTIQYHTLIRKFPGDSTFDVFPLSQHIPSSVHEFYDDLKFEQFPTTGFDSLFYKAFSTDDLGRMGDTSAPCTLIIAPQPILGTFDSTNGCITWKSWIRGGQISYGWFWNESFKDRLISKRVEAYPLTDVPAFFKVCITDSSLIKYKGTRLNYALFLEIGDIHSIRTGFIDSN